MIFDHHMGAFMKSELWFQRAHPSWLVLLLLLNSVRHEVIQSLEMVDCEFISTSPDRPNIYYEVRPRTEIDTDMKTIICSLKEHKNKAPRVVVYCRTLDICADLYAHFQYELGNDSYYHLEVTKLVIIVCLACFMQTHPSTTKK